MHIRITYNDDTSIELHSVARIERVYNAIEITCFGNMAVTHRNVKHVDIVDWRDNCEVY
jgi:hypothetical protein